MKTIIVPTDFSAAADHAFRYARQLACSCCSKIYLVHAVDKKSHNDYLRQANRANIESEKQKLFDARVSENHCSKVGLETKLLRGNVVLTICDFADSVNADLIIMGTNGLERELFDSITEKVASHSNIPVMVIPKGTVFSHPLKISLAVDKQPIKSRKILELSKQLARCFKTAFEFFHCNRSHEYDTVDATLVESVRDINHSVYNRFSNYNDINLAIEDYVDREAVDILVMIKRTKRFTESVFPKSITNTEIYNSRIPLLIVHDS